MAPPPRGRPSKPQRDSDDGPAPPRSRSDLSLPTQSPGPRRSRRDEKKETSTGKKSNEATQVGEEQHGKALANKPRAATRLLTERASAWGEIWWKDHPAAFPFGETAFHMYLASLEISRDLDQDPNPETRKEPAPSIFEWCKQTGRVAKDAKFMPILATTRFVVPDPEPDEFVNMEKIRSYTLEYHSIIDPIVELRYRHENKELPGEKAPWEAGSSQESSKIQSAGRKLSKVHLQSAAYAGGRKPVNKHVNQVMSIHDYARDTSESESEGSIALASATAMGYNTRNAYGDEDDDDDDEDEDEEEHGGRSRRIDPAAELFSDSDEEDDSDDDHLEGNAPPHPDGRLRRELNPPRSYVAQSAGDFATEGCMFRLTRKRRLPVEVGEDEEEEDDEEEEEEEKAHDEEPLRAESPLYDLSSDDSGDSDDDQDEETAQPPKKKVRIADVAGTAANKKKQMATKVARKSQPRAEKTKQQVDKKPAAAQKKPASTKVALKPAEERKTRGDDKKAEAYKRLPYSKKATPKMKDEKEAATKKVPAEKRAATAAKKAEDDEKRAARAAKKAEADAKKTAAAFKKAEREAATAAKKKAADDRKAAKLATQMKRTPTLATTRSPRERRKPGDLKPEPPKRKRSRNDEDEDEEEPAPKKSKKSTSSKRAGKR